MKTKVIFFAIIVGLLIFDQVSKYLAENFLGKNSIEIIPDFFSFTLAHNFGIAFSLPLPSFIVISLTVLVSVFLIWSIFKKIPLNISEKIAYCFILAGALGNLIDRLSYGFVIDFISVGSFPIFNLADSWISIGVVLLIWGEIFGKK